MFAQTHSRGPAFTPPSALPGVQNDDNYVDDVADIADEDIIDADKKYFYCQLSLCVLKIYR